MTPRAGAAPQGRVGVGEPRPAVGSSGGRARGALGPRGGFVFLLALSVPLLTFDLGRWVLATNDETRFPMLARDILARGHWWLPRLNDVVHLNKPPLYAWLTALAAWPAGVVSQRTAAYPSILASLGVVAATYWIGLRLLSRDTALAAGLIVLTTYGLFTLARVPMPDTMFCLALTGAVAAFGAAEFEGRRRALIVFYGLIGVGFWTKGPAALLALAVAVAYTVTVYGWSAAPRRLALGPGLLLLVLIALPWWLLDAAAGQGRFTQEIVLADWLLWYFPVGQWSWHAVTGPLGQALTILLPWSALLPVALWAAVRQGWPERPRALRLILIWGGAVFLLVAVCRQQRMRYYLPLCPPAALFLAAWWSGLALRHRRGALAGAWIAVALGLSLWQVHASDRHNAQTDLRMIGLEARQAAKPLYAVDVPELVLAFYLDQPVALLPDFARFQSLAAEGREGSLIVADRALPRELSGPAPHRLGAGLLNGRPLSLFSR